MLKLTSKGNRSVFGGSSMHKRKYSDDDISLMVSLKKDGLSYRDIGKRYGVTGATIRNTMIRHSTYFVIEEKPSKDYIPIQQYCELVCETYQSVYWHINSGTLEYMKYHNKLYVKHNATIKRRTINDDNIDMIIELNEQGLSQRKIASLVGCSQGTVFNYLKLFG